MSFANDSQMKEKMQDALEALKKEFGRVRTGRANLAILDPVRVDYYGQTVPLNQVATLSVPESRMITISPWEKSLIPEIEKAIAKANLGLTPSSDSDLVRLSIPPLTEQRRKELVKIVKNYGEECKISIRHARREALDHLKSLEKKNEITEDDLKKADQEIQKITNDFVAQVDQLLSGKEKEIMEV